MTTALVTGANGHIGSHVVRELVGRGWSVRAFVRPGSDRRAISGLPLELCEGDLLDAPSVARAMKGCEVVFHVGAVHRNFDPSPDAILRPAVDGTRHVLEAAIAGDVRRIVYTSSAATMGFTADPSHPLDESSFVASAESPYVEGKIEAEALVRAHAAEGRRPEVVIVNPSGVVGPRDYRITPATRLLIGLAQGDPAFLHVPITDVRDVARAHIAAALHGTTGERYLVTGEVLSPEALSEAIRAVTGHAPRVMTPPEWLLLALSRVQVFVARLRHTDAPLTPEIVHDAYGRHLAYDSTRSQRELDMSYRPAKEALTDAYRWLLFTGALSTRAAQHVRETLGALAGPDPDWLLEEVATPTPPLDSAAA